MCIRDSINAMTSNKNTKLLTHLLGNLKSTGRIVGTTAAAGNGLPTSNNIKTIRRPNYIAKPTVLKFTSYDPYLTKNDFLSLIPENVFAQAPLTTDMETKYDFTLIKKRDPKYFLFKDQYYLKFLNFIKLQRYSNVTKFARLKKVRVNFKPLQNIHENDLFMTNHQFYLQNLVAAYKSKEAYLQQIKGLEVSPVELSTVEMEEMEENSLVVWNLPNDMKPIEVQNYFCLLYTSRRV